MPAVPPRPGRGLSDPRLGAPGGGPWRGKRRQRLPWRAEHEGRPGAGRALYRGRRLRQEAWGGGRGSHAAPREGGGSAPGGHGIQPAAALTLACAPPASRPRPRPPLCISPRARRSLPAPLGPSPRGTPPPQTWGKVSQLQTGRESAPAPVPRLPAFPLGPQFRLPSGRRAEPSPEHPGRPLARPDPIRCLVPRASRAACHACGRSPAGLPSPRRWQLLVGGAPPAPLPGAALCQGSALPAPPASSPSPSPRLSSPCAGRAGPGPLTPP